MIVTGSRAHGGERRRTVGGDHGVPSVHKGEWMESGDDPHLSPTVFLVEQPPHSVLPTHFHRHNEFQVVVQGGGTLGRHAVGPVMVHYAGAYSGYGPIAAGPEGLSYFTIRTICESGVLTTRDEMKRGPKLQHHIDAFEASDPLALVRLSAPIADELLAREHGGLAVQRVRLGPSGESSAIDASGSAGQFHLVLAGSLKCEDDMLGVWESAFHSPELGAPLLRAGPDGADVLVLQLPRRAAEYEDS